MGRNAVKDGKAVARTAGPGRTPSATGRRVLPFPSLRDLGAADGNREMAGPEPGRPGRSGLKSEAEAPPVMAQPNAAICISAALRSTAWPGFSTARSKGFQRSPTTCS